MHCACGLVAVNDLVHRARADVLQLRPRRAPRRYGYTAGAALISRSFSSLGARLLATHHMYRTVTIT